ncbi:MAG: ABC transporter ATP-binding protein, partial [Bacteroidales bacterium]|nr:ABC transporter ATP-binding protein [Bacteroidales bacterium]
PTEGIQPSITFEIADVIRHLVEEKGLSVLLVEQKLDFARRLSDHYFIMDRGRVVESGDKDNIDYQKLKSYLSV